MSSGPDWPGGLWVRWILSIVQGRMSKTDRAGSADRQDQAVSRGGNAPTPVIRSETLLSARKEAVIEHRGERYLLRETSRGKLILTK